MTMTREEINAKRELAKVQYAAEAANKKGQGVMFMPDDNDSQEEINMEDINNAALVARITQIVLQEMKGNAVVQTSTPATFKSGTYKLTVTEVKVENHTNKAGVTNPWVRMTLKSEDFNRPVFSDITIAGKSKSVISDASVALKGKALTSRSNHAKFLESLVGMTVSAIVSQKVIGDNKTVLKTFIGSWKAA